MQTPTEYEGAGGEKLKAIPLGEKNNNLKLEPTGVESTITVTTAEPVEVRAITAEEIEAEQHAEEAKKLQEALQKQEASVKRLEEALKKGEEHASQLAGEAKKHEEEATAQLAATVKKYQEEVAATKKQLAAIEAKIQPPTRAQLLAKALKTCQKQPKKKQRAQCVASAHKKYRGKAA